MIHEERLQIQLELVERRALRDHARFAGSQNLEKIEERRIEKKDNVGLG